MKYSVLIFDLDDTLLDFQAGERKGLAVVFDQFTTASLPYDTWLQTYKEINQQTWQAIEKGANTQFLLNQRFSKAFAVHNQEIDGTLAEAVYRKELDTNYELLDGSREFMDQLSKKPYRLVAGTNGKTATQYQRLAHTGFDQYFEHIIISGEIGHAKPSPAFFDKIFEHYPDTPREHFLMIGDSLGPDIIGAKRSGIDCIWFNPTQKVNTTNYEPTYTAQNFNQLMEILSTQEKD